MILVCNKSAEKRDNHDVEDFHQKHGIELSNDLKTHSQNVNQIINSEMNLDLMKDAATFWKNEEMMRLLCKDGKKDNVDENKKDLECLIAWIVTLSDMNQSDLQR